MMKKMTCRSDEMISDRASVLLDSLGDAIANIPRDNSFLEAVTEIIQCEGKIITTGMGKAGIAMRKFSSTLCSLGFPSTYLHPGEASHGDLGLLQYDDILFVASTSGKTREVMEVVDLSKSLHIWKGNGARQGVKTIIGITSHPDSEIRKKADIILDMGDITESGDLGLAPTSSILVMLAITDTIALVASECKGLTAERYGEYHHGGYLGEAARERRDS